LNSRDCVANQQQHDLRHQYAFGVDGDDLFGRNLSGFGEWEQCESLVRVSHLVSQASADHSKIEFSWALEDSPPL
jgi:hypothetical protein